MTTNIEGDLADAVHAPRHATGAEDPIAPGDIGAATAASVTALSTVVAGLSTTAWQANTAYIAEAVVSHGVGLYQAPTGGVPSRPTFTVGDWNHLADIAMPVGTTAGTVAAGDDSRITGAASESALATEASTRGSADTTNATAIATETTNRTTAVSAEATARATADTINASAISAETSRATGVESTNASAIATETTNRTAAVTAEATRAQTAEGLAAQRSANLSDLADAGTSRANIHNPTLASCQAVATSNITLSGTQTVDGYAAAVGDQILAAGQTTGSQNGPWVVAAGAWTRPTDYTSGTSVKGRQIQVNAGSTYAGSIWVLKTTTSVTVDATATTWGRSNLSAYGVIPDAVNLGPYNFVNSGVVGSTDGSGSGTQNLDHTAAAQTFINAVALANEVFNAMSVAVIDFPPLRHYRFQNLTLPGNVHLRLNGSFCQYVSSAGTQNPPQGPGNCVFRCYNAFNQIEGGLCWGNGTQDTGVEGVWLMSDGQAYVGSPRSWQNKIHNMQFSNFAGRAVFDQGVGNHVYKNLGENSLLGATNIDHFMGAFEQAGTDGWMDNNECGPSVTTVSNGVAVPRCPVTYDTTAMTTTNGSISLPLSNGTITLTSTASASTTGGQLSIGGHLVTYTSVVDGTHLGGCYCADTGTIATATNVFWTIGFVSALHIGGGTNWSHGNVAEFGDVGISKGPNVLAHTVGSVTLTTSGVGLQPVVVDNAAHFGSVGVNGTGGGTVAIWSFSGSAIAFNRFTYTSISETTLAAVANLSTSGISVQVASTSGWPASGSFNAGGYTVTYTSVVDGTHLGGCTIAAGTVTLPSGTYIRSNTLNGCSVASGTLVVGNNRAILTILAAGSFHKTWANRSDFARTHGFIGLGGTGGQNFGEQALSGAATATRTYDAWHAVPAGSDSLSSHDSSNFSADNSVVTNLWRYVVNDLAAGAANHWIHPAIAFNFVLMWNISSANVVLIPNDYGTALPVNTAVPNVMTMTTGVCANTSATTLTNFSGFFPGQKVTIFQDTNTTIQHNANIVTLSGADIAPPASGYAVLKFQRMRTPSFAWYQV